MKRYILTLIFSLLLIKTVCAAPSTTLSISPAAVDATTITSSDENTRNNTISTWANNHDHNDIDQTSNTLAVGDAAAGNKTIQANNADSNKPYIRYDDTNDWWVFSENGVDPSVSTIVTGLVIEGTTNDTYETTLAITDPTADRTQTFQNNTGIVPLGTAGNTLFFTTTAATSVTLPTSGTISTYSDTRHKVGSFTRDLTAGAGSVAYTGVGFTPKAIIFSGGVDLSGTGTYAGFDDDTTAQDYANAKYNAAGDGVNSTGNSIALRAAAGDLQTASVASFDSDGFTLTWGKAGSPTGTATVGYIAFR